MALFRRSSSLLRCALARLRGHEQSGVLLQQQLPAQQAADSVFKSFSPSPFLGARFMCSIPSTKLFVGGLAWGIDENALRESFVEYGEVVEAKIVLDRETGRSKGFGFVSFTCTDHAEAAKNGLDGKMLSGRPLRVNFAIEKQRGFGSFGGGYGGGDSSSSYSGGSSINDGFVPSGSTNEGNDSFISNNTFNPDSLATPSTPAASNESASAGENDNFFSDDIFDDHDDAYGKDENFAQGLK